MTDEARTTEDKQATAMFLYEMAGRLCRVAQHANMAEAYNAPNDEACEYVQAACFQATEQAEEAVQKAAKTGEDPEDCAWLSARAAEARNESEDMDNETASESWASLAERCEKRGKELRAKVEGTVLSWG